VSDSTPRVIVVLGYSDGGRDAIHPICAARVARAGEISTAVDVVVLSGWARVAGTQSEAALMAAAWNGLAAEVVVDPDARTTVGNAFNALNDIQRVRAREVIVVTSRWHAPRAKAAFRLLLWRRSVRVATTFPPEPASLGSTLRELPLWPLLPAQLWHARQRLPRSAAPAPPSD
jgi:uncharacterized SAM-binding protein YcdF (DUF218 family)